MPKRPGIKPVQIQNPATYHESWYSHIKGILKFTGCTWNKCMNSKRRCNSCSKRNFLCHQNTFNNHLLYKQHGRNSTFMNFCTMNVQFPYFKGALKKAIETVKDIE